MPVRHAAQYQPGQNDVIQTPKQPADAVTSLLLHHSRLASPLLAPHADGVCCYAAGHPAPLLPGLSGPLWGLQVTVRHFCIPLAFCNGLHFSGLNWQNPGVAARHVAE